MLFQGDAPEGSDTIQWPVIERDRVGWLRLIIWDKVKVPLCHYRVMHRKRVTSELHDSYFRLMMITQAIPKIAEVTYPNRQISEEIAEAWRRVHMWTNRPTNWTKGQLNCSQLETRCGRKATPGRRGLRALMNWGPEKMLIWCSKESQHPAEWTPASGEQERHNVDGHNNGVKILQFLFGLQLPLTRKPWVTLFEPLQIKWEVNILLKKTSCVCLSLSLHCYYCVVYDTAHENITLF